MAEHSMTIGRVHAPEPNLSQTIELAQRVAIDRLRLLQLDLEERAREVLRRSTWIGVGIFCLLAAWIGILGAAVFALAEWIPMAASLLVVAGSQLLVGAAAILWGGRARERT